MYDDFKDFYESYDRLDLKDDHEFRLYLLILLGAISESLEKIAQKED